MAYYKIRTFLAPTEDPVFDQTIPGGGAAPATGIFRCIGCTKEVIAFKGAILPIDGEHLHSASQGLVRWRLVVAPDFEGA